MLKKVYWFLLLYLLILVLFLSHCSKSKSRIEYFGTFYANDCGVSHGGYEWAGDYTATLVIDDSKGTLSLVFSMGLGDYLTKHQFTVSDFSQAGGMLSFNIEGRQALLEWVENDTIWNGDYDNHYIANNSDDVQERIGQLPIEVFTGFISHYYIELRLKSAQPESRFNLVR
ncbi:MAG: hypothetical protein ACETWK_12730 [Candidatus Aminicenantaceae bacterium]